MFYLHGLFFLLGVGLNPNQAHKSQTLILPTPFQEAQTTLPSRAGVLPSPFQNAALHQGLQSNSHNTIVSTIADNSTDNKADNSADNKADDFATEIHQLIRDVYSEREVPFNPLQEQNHIPDWIFLQQYPHQGEGHILFLHDILSYAFCYMSIYIY